MKNDKGTLVDAVKQVMKNQMEEIKQLESEFISMSKFPDHKVTIGPKYHQKNPFTLYNTTTVYRVYDDNDEYDVSKIETEGNIEWKVESITYSNPHKNSSLYKNLIEYCKGL
jgi:hypothetical protein